MGDDDDDDDYQSPFNSNITGSDYYEPHEFQKKFSNIQSVSSYFHLNCRSLNSNWDGFRNLLCDLHGETFAFDFIGISEVFGNTNDGRTHLHGYHDFLTRTRGDKRGGGVGLFVKDNINYKIREDLSIFIPHIFESIFIETQYETKGKSNEIIGVIYRPNTQPRADLDVFTSTLFDLLEIINHKHIKCKLLGDFNINLLNYGHHDKTNTYVDSIFSLGFLPQITKPTRITTSTATLLDHIYSNTTLTESINGIIINDVADHFGIFYIETHTHKHSCVNIKQKRFFSENNALKFHQLLLQTDFTSVYDYNCPDHAYNTFIEKYLSAFNLAFPVKNVIMNRKYIKREPWMSEGLLVSLRNKSRLLKKKLEDPSVSNNLEYKTYLNYYNKLKRNMKINYFKSQLEANKNNIKNTWKILRSAINKTNDKSNLPQTFNIDGKNVSDTFQIAESFNKFYVNIGKSTSEQVPISNKHFTDYLKINQTNSMFLEPVDKCQILEIVNKFKPKISSGHDEIPTKIMKQSISEIIEPLTYIINKSLETGVVPNKLKIAKVIPLFKSLQKNELKNYRPVSLLPAFSKVFEKVIFNKIMAFINSRNILYKHQYGFRSKHATIHPIIHLLNNCASANNSNPKQLTATILCDLSKAFDVISHSILFKKLEYCGLRGNIKNWLVNYLTNRQQFVQVGKSRSNFCKIECGVPQGSILGPLLYLLYVNDIAHCTDSHILSFADDTTLFVSDSDPKTLFEKTNIETNKLFNWFCANRLSLNPQKTKFIIIKPSKAKFDFSGLNILINGIPLERIGVGLNEESSKFLGVILDDSLTWKHHINHINKKISKSLFAIKQVKHILNIDSLKTLYFALIQPYINYGILAWGNATNSILKRTVVLQKRAIRTICKAKYNSHTEPLFKKLEILNIKDQFQYEVTLFMNKYRQHQLPYSFHKVFSFNHEIQGRHTTRLSNQLYIERCDSTFASKLPLFEFPKIWNKWSYCAHNTFISQSMLKKKLKTEMLSHYANSVRCDNTHCKDCHH
jgi:hypothetical protein